MKYGMIFRGLLEENERAGIAIHELSPDIVVVPLDFGGRARVRSGGDVLARQEIIKVELDAQLASLLPHIDKAVLSVMIETYYLPSIKDQDKFRTEVFPSVFRFFPDISTVYLDLGITPNYTGLNKLCDSLFELADKMQEQLDPGFKQVKFIAADKINIGLIAPIRHWLQPGPLQDLAKNERIIPCPVATIEPITPQAEKVALAYPKANLFVSTGYSQERNMFPEIDGPETLIFWSPFSLSSYASIRKAKITQEPETRNLEHSVLLKKRPTESGLAIRMLKAGTSILLLSENGDYLQVKTELGEKGYIYKKDIQGDKL